MSTVGPFGTVGTIADVDHPEIPKWNQMFRPTIEALRALGGSGTIQEINEKAIELEGYTDEQLAVLHGDGEKSEIEYRLAWARTNLKNLGALTNSRRGVWALTEYGREVTEAELIERDKEWRKDLAAIRSQKLIEAAVEPAEDEEVGLDAGEDWKTQLLRCLMEMPPASFERLSQRVLREAGFVNVRVTGRPGDGGIDGTGIYRLSPLVSFPTFFQCKRYRGSVSPGHVRDFRGAMAGRGDKGLLITTGSFSKDARLEATRDGAQPIELIDGEMLCDLLKQYELGVETVPRVEEDITVRHDFFEDI
ncbi:MAG: restriction endonuclease [Actinobacteria bacterium]|nr:restriction endonuclease [Actinomycetota bacterium]